MPQKLTIELISTFTCKRCQMAQQKLRNILSQFDAKEIEYKEVSVFEQLDYVVSLGILNTPAIAVNGQLRFHSIPTEKKLLAEISKLLEDNNHVSNR